jgi:hypothetical protein
MKILEIKDVFQGVVSSQTDVSVELEAGEAAKLREALALIQKYEKAALKALKQEKGYCVTESDWHNIQYAVKNDRIIVKIKDGMAG